MTVDATGDLWVAIYGGGRVQRYAPDGELRLEMYRPGHTEHLLRVRGTTSEPPLYHHSNRELEQRAASCRARSRARLLV